MVGKWVCVIIKGRNPFLKEGGGGVKELILFEIACKNIRCLANERHLVFLCRITVAN